jgi:small-conductance mechanosensitive channel/CRP-like cAMP-binding protein
VLEGLEQVVPYIKNIALAAAILLAAYLLTIPLRRRYGPSFGIEPKRRSRRQFIWVLLSYPAFTILVLVPSVPLIYWLNRTGEPGRWSLYYQAWLSFWIIHLIIRLAEGLFVEIFVQMGRECPLTRLSRSLLRLAIMLGVAFILIKYQMNFNIAVLLTSTAILTGVIGFAMQGVLGNLLAGMSLHASRTMSIGDWVEVDGEIGKVILVNWRETRLRTLGGHIVVVPNGKLANLTIKNFSSPTKLRRHEIAVAASYGDKPGDVIEALIEAAQNVPIVEKRPPPDAYVTGFKDFCIEYVLRFWSKQYEQFVMIEGNVMRMIWYKFNRRGIEIPFPMSGRLLGNFLEAVHAQKFEKPLASEIESCVDDLLRSDFGSKLMADAEGNCLLSRDELRTVARNVKRTYFTKGETLMHQNDAGESFYVLVRGTAHGSIANPDTDRNVEFDLQAGALFGEMSLLTGLPRSATITATTDCELLEFDRNAFTCLLSVREEVLQVLSDLAAARTAENAEALEKLRTSTATPVVLERDGIVNRLKRMLSQWRGRRTK